MDKANYKKDLESQIRDAFGKVTYTYTCFLKQRASLMCCDKWIKILQIVLSAISTVGVLGVLFIDAYELKVCNAVVTAILLGITLYFKEFHLSEDIRQFTMGADDLWSVKEDYVSLLTDLSNLEVSDIVQKRDELKERTLSIYKKYPKTNSRSYRKAQKALKKEEEQFFTDSEIDNMLPRHLRTK